MSEVKKKHPVLTTEEREAHPGWAIRFNDGTWLCTNMMCDKVSDAFYATRYESSETALSEMRQAQKEWCDTSIGEAVVAWEPLAESLRVRISSLRDALKITPDDIFEMTLSLENALSILKG